MKTDQNLTPLYFTLALGLLAGIMAIALVLFLSCNAQAKKKCTTFASGSVRRLMILQMRQLAAGASVGTWTATG